MAGNTHINNNQDEEVSTFITPKSWFIEKEENCNNLFLCIPEDVINGVVVDGQHRLFSFKGLNEEMLKKYELICTLYLDLPTPYQAYLFATINMNQRKVNKSLAYELYGYDLDEDFANMWSPEKLAVFLTRKLNVDNQSIFKGRVLLIANSAIINNRDDFRWTVTTATVVEGILKLITSNTKRDFDFLHKLKESQRDRKKLEVLSSRAPLRTFYLEQNDLLIYTIVLNFFNASYSMLFEEGNLLFKNIGIQVQFEVLKRLLQDRFDEDKSISIQYFLTFLKKFMELVLSIIFFNYQVLEK
ncbi:DGQHR domain-containing protein [Myroides sp. mNGS23_01]|nr:DGQHR domain-containing protein [Myroides sp. mNGS23_01]WHT40840.1 DGQHR domain-containing protein [Myroides sp. mNGS23_01]